MKTLNLNEMHLVSAGADCYPQTVNIFGNNVTFYFGTCQV